MTDNSAVLSKSPDVVSRKIDEESILVPIRQTGSDVQCIYTLDGVASRIWDLIDGERTASEIADLIVSEYDVTIEQARIDIGEFVDGLVETGCASWAAPTLGE
jgi:hypothetical protein